MDAHTFVAVWEMIRNPQKQEICILATSGPGLYTAQPTACSLQCVTTPMGTETHGKYSSDSREWLWHPSVVPLGPSTGSSRMALV